MDTKTFKAINGLAGRSFLLDMLMILISNRVRYVFTILLCFLWFRNETSKKMVFNAVISTLIAIALNSFIKRFYFKPRPFVKQRVAMLLPSKKDSSFPSKHTLLSFALSTSVALRERLIGSIMIGLSLLTGLSRIWVGHHYPSDIIKSAVMGSFIGFVVNKRLFLNMRKLN